MSDDDTFIPEADLDDSGQPRMVQMKRTDIRLLEKQAKKAREYEAKLADMERERAFMTAGVPVDDPAAKYFVKGYDGPLDPDSIKTAAIEARIISPTSASQQEIAAHEAAQAAAAGGTPTTVAPDFQAELAEMAKKRFAVTDEEARQDHIREIAALAKKAGANIPLS